MKAKFKKIRVVVEVTVAYTHPINEKDLQSSLLTLIPSKMRVKGHLVSPKLKLFGSFWPMFLNGRNHFKKAKSHE